MLNSGLASLKPLFSPRLLNSAEGSRRKGLVTLRIRVSFIVLQKGVFTIEFSELLHVEIEMLGVPRKLRFGVEEEVVGGIETFRAEDCTGAGRDPCLRAAFSKSRCGCGWLELSGSLLLTD